MRRDDSAVSAVLGTLLMLALMVSMLPAMLALSDETRALAEAQMDATRAERERAERAAYCARNPDVGAPYCDAAPLPGYSCVTRPSDAALVCVKTPPPIVAGVDL